MDDWRFGEAIDYIKALQKLQLSSWMYSLTIANYAVCLVRLKALSHASEMHQKLLDFYEKVLPISSRDLLTAANDTIQHSGRPLRAALFYHGSSKISTKHGSRSRAVRTVAECVEGLLKCIKKVAEVQCSTAYIKQQREAMKYLFLVMEDIVNSIDDIPDKDNLKLKRLKERKQDDCSDLVQQAKYVIDDCKRTHSIRSQRTNTRNACPS